MTTRSTDPALPPHPRHAPGRNACGDLLVMISGAIEDSKYAKAWVLHVCVCVCMIVSVYEYMYVCMYVRIYVFVYVCMYVRTYIRTYVCTYVSIAI
jgi:hypothetical protein